MDAMHEIAKRDSANILRTITIAPNVAPIVQFRAAVEKALGHQLQGYQDLVVGCMVVMHQSQRQPMVALVRHERVTMYRSNGAKMCRIECSRFAHDDKSSYDYELHVNYEFTIKRKRVNRRTRATQRFPMVVVPGWGHPEPQNFMNDAGTENRHEIGSRDAESAFFAAFDKSGLTAIFDTRKM